MHNNIMAAGSKDRPPMLGPGRYSQWRSRFLRYIDTKPNGEGLRKSILSGPYVPSTVLVQAVAATEGNPAIQQHTTIETVLNMTPENKEHFLSEKEAIFLLLTGIGDDIYSTVDACKTANEMWIAIERLQQGESLNVQDVKTNLFWEFGKFTSRDGETMESYYSRFYKLMNELTRNNLQVTTMQVNVQFLQQLQPEWSRFVTVVKQSKEIDTISYHTLFDILKQYQNEVNDIRAERIAKSANPLALLAAAQPYSDNYYQAPKPQRSNATSSSTRPSASTRHKGKEIAKPVTPQSESVSEEDSDPEQAQRDKDMQKNLALLAKNKTEDTTPRYNNDNQSGQFGNQRTMTVAGTRETVGSPVVQQTGIQCFNYKGFGHYAKEYRKPKRVKDYTYHKEKMMMCKQAEQGVPLQAECKDQSVMEFGKFTSRDGESMESFYSGFINWIDEIDWRNNLQQYQNEVNDIRAERIAKSANPLALLAAAQPYSDNYYQAPKPQRSNATVIFYKTSASSRHKGKEIAKTSYTLNLRLYKPTNNNLRTSLNSRNKTEDTTPRYNNDNQSGQFGNQRTMTVAGTRETVGSPVVQQTGIQCFNCKGIWPFAKDWQEAKAELKKVNTSLTQELEELQDQLDENKYIKNAQSAKKPGLYEIPCDTSDLAKQRFRPNREETFDSCKWGVDQN
ncbi:hypothetical protein Tco_1377623 [Tanacetum coccineum]